MYTVYTYPVQGNTSSLPPSALEGFKNALILISIPMPFIAVYAVGSFLYNQSFNNHYFVTPEGHFAKNTATGLSKSIKEDKIDDIKFVDNKVVVSGESSEMTISFSDNGEVTRLQESLYNI